MMTSAKRNQNHAGLTPDQHADQIAWWDSGDNFDRAGRIIALANWKQETAEHLAMIADRLELTRPATILDIGTGTGRLAGPLALAGHLVTGLDIGPQMLEQARHTWPAFMYRPPARPPAFLLVGADYAFPVPAAHFDAAFAFLLFQHLPTRGLCTRYLRETARALKPGGRFVLQSLEAAPNQYAADAPTWHGYTFADVDTLAAHVEACGFTILEASKGQGHPLWQWITATTRPCDDRPH